MLALTSPNPSTTTPPSAPDSQPRRPHLGPYPKNLSRQLKLTLVPLDVTTEHLLTPKIFHKYADGPLKASSPLAEWATAFLSKTFSKVNEKAGALSLHDPLAAWYGIKRNAESEWTVEHDKDIRVEAAGQWTRGFCVSDRREHAKEEKSADDADVEKHVSGDAGGWFSARRGNRVSVLIGTPVMEHGKFGELLCQRLFESPE